MKRYQIGITCLLLGLSYLPSHEAYADIVTYDESISGDLVHNLPYSQTTDIGTFDIGINSVSGNVSVLTDGSYTDFSDLFIFHIPNGQLLTSATLYFSNVIGYSSFITTLTQVNDIASSSGTALDSMQIWPATQILPVAPFDSTTPLVAGTYAVSIPSAYGWSGDINMDYSWEFTVTAIPIPPALWLFGSGLLGLIGFARK